MVNDNSLTVWTIGLISSTRVKIPPDQNLVLHWGTTFAIQLFRMCYGQMEVPSSNHHTLLNSWQHGVSHTLPPHPITHNVIVRWKRQKSQWRSLFLHPGLADLLTLSHSLLPYWNTPCKKDGQSPVQKLFGHPVQDTLPARHRLFAPEWLKSVQDAEKAAADTQIKLHQLYNQHAHELFTL